MKTEMEIFDSIKDRVEIRGGCVYWVSPYHSKNIGRPAGVKDKNGYRRMHVGKGRMIGIHRLAFYIHNGYVPEIVDHANGNVEDNSLENLRPADRFENARNCKVSIKNTSGERGVYLHSKSGRWLASIRINGKLKHLGSFGSIDEAVKARRSAEEEYFGEFAGRNRVPLERKPS